MGKTPVVQPVFKEVIELLDGEKAFGSDSDAGYQIAIMILSIYKKDSSSSSSGIDDLVSRARQVLTANPWMMARVRHLTKPTKRLAMTIEEKHCNPDDYIQRNIDDEVFQAPMKYDKIRTYMKKYDVGYVNELWDKDSGKLCKFGIIESTDKSQFCVYISASHIAFDGCTLYNIWKQLDPAQPERSLNPVRFQGLGEGIQKETSTFPAGLDMMGFWGEYENSDARYSNEGMGPNIQAYQTNESPLQYQHGTTGG